MKNKTPKPKVPRPTKPTQQLDIKDLPSGSSPTPDNQSQKITPLVKPATVKPVTVEKENSDLINFNLSIFSLFLSLTFAYFVYFSYQLFDTQSQMVSRIYEINAINLPYPLQFLAVTGHKKYLYPERRDALREEFRSLINQLNNPNLSENEMTALGTEIMRVITQIAYSYPYRKKMQFNPDGSALFPISEDAIDIKNGLQVNVLGQQIDEIYNWNAAFTVPLKDSKEKIAQAMILSANIKDEYTKSRVTKYLDSLINYLEKHYELGMPLGFMLVKYGFIQQKVGKWSVILSILFLSTNFIFGIFIPSFWAVRKYKLCKIVALLSFVSGVIFLFKDALSVFPY